MESTVIERPAFNVVGITYRGKNEAGEIAELWERFAPRMGGIEGRTNPNESFGISDNMDEATGEFDYLACVEVNPGAPVPQGMEAWEVPALRYAVFKGSLPTIKDDFKSLHSDWLPESGHNPIPGPVFEYYADDFEVDETIYLWVPIE